MKRLEVKWWGMVLLLAAGIHLLVLQQVPRIIMKIVAYRLEKQSGANAFYHAPVPEAGNDAIVRMSPDILYSASVYDVSEHPLRFTFQTPDSGTYWSVSLYDARNSANVYSLSDKKVSRLNSEKEVVLVLKLKGGDYRVGEGEEVAELEYPRGILIKRFIVENRYQTNSLKHMIQIQKYTTVEEVLSKKR